MLELQAVTSRIPDLPTEILWMILEHYYSDSWTLTGTYPCGHRQTLEALHAPMRVSYLFRDLSQRSLAAMHPGRIEAIFDELPTASQFFDCGVSTFRHFSQVPLLSVQNLAPLTQRFSNLARVSFGTLRMFEMPWTEGIARSYSLLQLLDSRVDSRICTAAAHEIDGLLQLSGMAVGNLTIDFSIQIPATVLTDLSHALQVDPTIFLSVIWLNNEYKRGTCYITKVNLSESRLTPSSAESGTGLRCDEEFNRIVFELRGLSRLELRPETFHDYIMAITDLDPSNRPPLT